jgi:hypothetical protein
MSEEKPKPKKLTEAEKPELKGFYGGSVCRFYDRFENETACSSAYSSEDACANAAASYGAYGYSWTGKPC